uniref:Uncharacterized protein n=1 Tax=Anguilla anguilla TaxID=7936 RepID=A0A0E9R3Z0_ANGAN
MPTLRRGGTCHIPIQLHEFDTF